MAFKYSCTLLNTIVGYYNSIHKPHPSLFVPPPPLKDDDDYAYGCHSRKLSNDGDTVPHSGVIALKDLLWSTRKGLGSKVNHGESQDGVCGCRDSVSDDELNTSISELTVQGTQSEMKSHAGHVTSGDRQSTDSGVHSRYIQTIHVRGHFRGHVRVRGSYRSLHILT